jgi:hypothetical protein
VYEQHHCSPLAEVTATALKPCENQIRRRRSTVSHRLVEHAAGRAGCMCTRAEA